MTDDDEALTDLKRFARACMTTMRKRIEAGGEVGPVVFLLLPDGSVINTSINLPTAEQRAAMMRMLVETTHARALLLVTDAWHKDPKDPSVRLGELLSAMLITRDDPDNGVGYMQLYRRNPFTWDPIQENTGASFAHEVFPRTSKPH